MITPEERKFDLGMAVDNLEYILTHTSATFPLRSLTHFKAATIYQRLGERAKARMHFSLMSEGTRKIDANIGQGSVKEPN